MYNKSVECPFHLRPSRSQLWNDNDIIQPPHATSFRHQLHAEHASPTALLLLSSLRLHLLADLDIDLKEL
jgi:hypothetical protein